MIHANYGINHRSYRYEPNGGWGNWPNDHPKLDDSDSGYYEVLVKLIRNQSYGFAEKGLLYEFIPDGEDFFQVNPTKPPKVNVTKPPKVNVTKPPKVNVTNTLKAEAKTLKAEAKNPPKGARKVSGSAAAAK
ncbi:hypothetical protein OAN22_01895 [Alphaproteobacteria bacterium]|nr:hypothetical protein [Alphaproteobacteria bacterium]